MTKMIKIYPFKSLLPSQENASKIACEPYDVISAAEARERAVGNSLSYLHVVRPEIDFPEDADPYDDRIYDKAASNLQTLIDNGHLSEEEQPGVFLYRQIFQQREQYGIVCCYDVEQYRDGTIKKHEKTRPDKEDDRTRHLTTCSAHAEPVFLCFKDDPVISELIRVDCGQQPIIDFVADDDVTHTVWRATDSQAYVHAFENVESVYIADGHHRTAAGERAATARQQANPNHHGGEEYNRVLSVMFPAGQLEILAYNRVVKDLNGLSTGQFLEQLSGLGAVAPVDNPVPDKTGKLCIYVDKNWYHFEFPTDSIDLTDPINSLDVALLQSRILEQILGVGDPRTDKRIGFVGGIRGTDELEKRVDSGEMAVAFSMYPTSIEQLIDVSDSDKIMPPKSTWFEPKLKSGLFVHRFEK